MILKQLDPSPSRATGQIPMNRSQMLLNRKGLWTVLLLNRGVTYERIFNERFDDLLLKSETFSSCSFILCRNFDMSIVSMIFGVAIAIVNFMKVLPKINFFGIIDIFFSVFFIKRSIILGCILIYRNWSNVRVTNSTAYINARSRYSAWVRLQWDSVLPTWISCFLPLRIGKRNTLQRW